MKQFVRSVLTGGTPFRSRRSPSQPDGSAPRNVVSTQTRLPRPSELSAIQGGRSLSVVCVPMPNGYVCI